MYTCKVVNSWTTIIYPVVIVVNDQWQKSMTVRSRSGTIIVTLAVTIWQKCPLVIRHSMFNKVNSTTIYLPAAAEPRSHGKFGGTRLNLSTGRIVQNTIATATCRLPYSLGTVITKHAAKQLCAFAVDFCAMVGLPLFSGLVDAWKSLFRVATYFAAVNSSGP